VLYGVFERLFQGPAIATADDKHALRVGVGDHGGVDKHLVVEVLIDFRSLHGVVQNQHAAEHRADGHLHALIRRAMIVQDVVYL
jgi:hypothetical protein